jgi:hypothetical protein
MPKSMNLGAFRINKKVLNERNSREKELIGKVNNYFPSEDEKVLICELCSDKKLTKETKEKH